MTVRPGAGAAGRIRDQLVQLIARGEEFWPAHHPTLVRVTPLARRAFDLALHQAVSLRQDYIGPEPALEGATLVLEHDRLELTGCALAPDDCRQRDRHKLEWLWEALDRPALERDGRWFARTRYCCSESKPERACSPAAQGVRGCYVPLLGEGALTAAAPVVRNRSR